MKFEMNEQRKNLGQFLCDSLDVKYFHDKTYDMTKIMNNDFTDKQRKKGVCGIPSKILNLSPKNPITLQCTIRLKNSFT